MKATKLVTTAAVATLGFTLLAPSVLAADNDAKTHTGKGTVSYTEDDTPEKEKDPEIIIDLIPNPDIEVNTESGPLRVDLITPLDFGKGNISTAEGTFKAAASKRQGKLPGSDDVVDVVRGNYVQVTDKRAADDTTNKSKGWKLSAALTKQFTSGTSVLKGSKITYTDPVVTYAGDEGSTAKPRPDLLKDAANGFSKLAMEPISMKEDGTSDSVEMLKAAEGSGFGTYFLQFGRNKDFGGTINGEDTTAKSVFLTVPANTQMKKAAYTSEITWTISEL